MNPPATTKSNTVDDRVQPGRRSTREGTLWFDWIPRLGDPGDHDGGRRTNSSIAQIKKATGSGNINYFTIEVEVWEELGSERLNLIATYLVVSDGGLLTVTLQS